MAFALAPEQQQALDLFAAGENIFLTGPGGSGKSVLIRRMVEHAKTHDKKVQVCALTGCAALLLNCKAQTVHGWAGIGLAAGPIDLLVKNVVGNKYKREKWTQVDILIIDEVSMLSQKLFELLDACGKATRKSGEPFGGLQLVCAGDFYQLPPVGTNNRPETLDEFDEDTQEVTKKFEFVNVGAYTDLGAASVAEKAAGLRDRQSTAAFCFESPLWRATFPHTIQLQKIFRQTDLLYQKILNEIRVGCIRRSSLKILEAQVGKQQAQVGKQQAQQAPHSKTFKPTILLPRRRDVDAINARELQNLPPGVTQVYLAERVDTPNPHPEKKMRFAAQTADREFQLLLAKLMCEQRLTLKVGAQVMCIVNLDLVSDLPIVNGSQGVVVGFDESRWPIVEFTNGLRKNVKPHLWQSDYMPNVGVKQLPLIHAWAITIHKAQGASLTCAEIDAGSNIFECGQTYVALSRVQSLDGLYLAAFDPARVTVNSKVQEFYAGLA